MHKGLLLLAASFAAVAISFSAQSLPYVIPAPPELPPGLTLEQIKVISARRTPLVVTYNSLKAKQRTHDARCKAVDVDANPGLAASCASDQATIQNEIGEYEAQLEKLEHFINSAFIPDEIDGDEVSEALLEVARKDKRFSGKEITRLERAFGALRQMDGGAKADVISAWKEIFKRQSDSSFKAALAKAEGPPLEWAGLQTKFGDCTLFSMANAGHVPYGVVAQLANSLIRKATYRDSVQRLQPQKMIKEHGLYGHELIYIAESLGQVSIIDKADFAATIRGGAPVMLDVLSLRGTGAHQIVLNKIFTHKGDIWYGMIDSNNGQMSLSQRELDTIAIENGIVYRPDNASRLLR